MDGHINGIPFIITYENPESIAFKYAIEDLGGVMIWAYLI